MVGALRRWQKRLLQLDRRNSLLYFSPEKRGVSITNFSADELLQALGSARNGLAFPALEVRANQRDMFALREPQEATAEPQTLMRAGDLSASLQPADLQKRLTQIARRAKEWQEEQGLSVQFLAMGFLHWRDQDSEPAISPLLLTPTTLRRTSPRDAWRLHAEDLDDIQVNATLRHALSSGAGMTLAELGEDSIETYFESVERAIAVHADWKVDRTVAIANFPFSKLAMWADLDGISRSESIHPLVRRLAGDQSAATEIAGSDLSAKVLPDNLAGAALDDLLDIRDQHTVVDADFSQLRAIERSRSGTNLVIHGPPGTGKSQTIANIIATALADGKTVLFVSEKTAALDVVKKRLSDVGLGSLCLDLHSERAHKASVYQQLRDSLEAAATGSADFPFDRLVKARDSLNAAIRELHVIREPLGLSVYDVHGIIAHLGELPAVRLPYAPSEPLTADLYGKLTQMAERITRRPREYQGHHTSMWRALRDRQPSVRIVDDISAVLQEFSERLVALELTSNTISEILGVDRPQSIDEVKALIELTSHIDARPISPPAHWAAAEQLEAARIALHRLRELSSRYEAVTARLRDAGLQHDRIAAVHNICAEIQGVSRISARLRRVAGDSWEAAVFAQPEASVLKGHMLQQATSELHDAVHSLRGTLRLSSGTQVDGDIASVVRIGAVIRDIGSLPSGWCSPEGLSRASGVIQEATPVVQGIVEAEEALLQHFDEALIEAADQALLARFRTDYQSPIFWLKPAYWRDKRLLQGLMLNPQQWSRGVASTAIEAAVRAKRLKERWQSMEPAIQQALGTEYLSVNQKWTTLGPLVDSARSLFESGPISQRDLAALLAESSARTEINDKLQVAERNLDRLRQLWPFPGNPETENAESLAADLAVYANATRQIKAALDAVAACSRTPVSLGELETLLMDLSQREDLEATLAEKALLFQEALGPWYEGWQTHFPELEHAISWSKQFHNLTKLPLSTELAAILSNTKAATGYTQESLRCREDEQVVRSALTRLEEFFPESQNPWGSWTNPSLQLLLAWSRELRDHVGDSVSWLEYRRIVNEIEETFGPGIISNIRNNSDSASECAAIIKRHVLLGWLDKVYSSTSALRQSPVDLQSIAREFRSLDAAFPRYSRNRVRENCATPIRALARNQSHGELGTLTRELSKKRRQLPVRKLITTIPNVLQVLKPCFMMSPLAVSQYLPRGASSAATLTFDITIFDEASQVFPEDAVPALSRGKQAIVVGDQQQLPPTGFFRSEYDEAASQHEEDETLDRLADVESILDALVGMRGSGVEDVYLEVHYRSQHDSLIRFSNHYFYDDRLLTFPAAAKSGPGLGVRGVYVPEGRFDSGASQTNRIEAERLVEEVFRLLEERGSDQSIGVVALSRAQADLIQQLVDQRRVNDRRYDAFFADDRKERFFVKNLENVQGDERDHIFISIGYGPTTASNIVPNRFGPINLDGGHRRLNVAVSRARVSVCVLHSLRPEDIRSEGRGPRLLRRYLEFVRDGDAAIEGAVSFTQGGEAESPFEEAVGRELEKRGHRIVRQVGCAKFWIDLAILAEDGLAFDLAIECDGKAFHSSPSARDRDRIRQEVLERLGWRGRIHRVWSSAWIRNPKAELDAIEEALAQSRALPRGVRSEVRSEPPPDALSDAAIDDSSNATVSQPKSDSAQAAAPAFAPYVFADLRRFGSGNDLREEAPSKLASLITAIVDIEGPVLDDVVIDRVRTHYGLSRAGVNVRKAIQDGIDAAVERRMINVVGQDMDLAQPVFLSAVPNSVITPRAAAADGSLRKIDQIPHQEIEAGVISILRTLVASSRSDLVEVTARAFGFARTGEAVQTRLSNAISRLQTAGRITERMGSLVLSQ